MSRPLVLFRPPRARSLLRSSSSCSLHSCMRARTRPRKCAGTGAYMQPEHLWRSTPNVFYSITISSGAVTYARLSKVARACQFDEV